MKKGYGFFFVCWLVVLTIFNIISFAVPLEKNVIFWAVYSAITISFIFNLVCAIIALSPQKLNKVFLNIPLLNVSITGIAVTFIFGLICLLIPGIPNWLAILICALVVLFNILSIVKAGAWSILVSSKEEKDKIQTAFLTNLKSEAGSLKLVARSAEAKKECDMLFDCIRYSDPMSTPELKEVETQISLKFSLFSEAVKNDNKQKISEYATELSNLIKERNQMCKRNK